MKKTILSILCAVATVMASAHVKTGVEVLRDGGFRELQGKRVGLVTNPSGVDSNLKSTVDIINEAPGVKLVALSTVPNTAFAVMHTPAKPSAMPLTPKPE